MTAAADAEWTDCMAQFRAMMGITANLPGTTVSRVRLDFFAASVSNASPTYIGLQKVKLTDITDYQASAAQSLAAAPHSELHADWMLWRALYPNHGADPTTGLPNAATYEIDVRAMRRLDEAQETLALVVGKSTTVAGWSALVSCSVLLALP